MVELNKLIMQPMTLIIRLKNTANKEKMIQWVKYYEINLLKLMPYAMTHTGKEKVESFKNMAILVSLSHIPEP